MYDLLIQNGTIVTVNSEFEIIENGFIAISGDRLERIQPIDPSVPLPAARESIDAAGGIIMPGLINTHTHLPMTLFRGLADDLPLQEWLNQHIFPAEARHIRPETVQAGTRLACAEMLLSGTTCCCDGYFYENDVATAAAELGMRAVLGQGVIDFPAPGVPDPSDNIKAAERHINRWKNASPLIVPSVFCHSPYTCSARTLKRAKALARDAGVLFQIHLAETRAEVDQLRSEHQTSPVDYLNSLNLLDPDTLLVHAVWLSEHDIATIAGTRAAVSHNPESNMKLASGIAPVPALLARNVTIGLGTDGCASNNDLDLFLEMDTAAKLHKASTMDPTVVDARSVLKMATIDGARAIGMADRTGSLEEGKQADVVVLDTRSPHLIPDYNPVSRIVYSARGSDVRDVVIAGQIRVRDRTILQTDLEQILREARELADSINPNEGARR